MFLRESTFFVHHPIEISHNTAQDGGGIYAYTSEIEFDPQGTIGFVKSIICSSCVHVVTWKLDCL